MSILPQRSRKDSDDNSLSKISSVSHKKSKLASLFMRRITFISKKKSGSSDGSRSRSSSTSMACPNPKFKSTQRSFRSKQETNTSSDKKKKKGSRRKKLVQLMEDELQACTFNVVKSEEDKNIKPPSFSLNLTERPFTDSYDLKSEPDEEKKKVSYLVPDLQPICFISSPSLQHVSCDKRINSLNHFDIKTPIKEFSSMGSLDTILGKKNV